MNKTLFIEGMTCDHCKMRVEKALNKIEGVKAKVELENKLADVTLTKDVDDKILIEAIENAGYNVSSVK